MTLPRLGFLGVGWIGRNRMEAMLAAGGLAVAVTDPSPANLAEAMRIAPSATAVDSLDAMLALDLDAMVIATPSALHAEQTIAALDRGLAVFCQKPLGRNGAEVEQVLAAARRADRHIGVDLSYRHTAAIQPIRDAVRQGALGRIYGCDLVFHNAYGPDKPWFYDPALSGGGCLIDLGVHLIDLALWILDYPDIRSVSGRLLANGAPLADRDRQVEDYAVAEILLESGTPIRIACSWRLAAGQEAVISADFYGTEGGAAMRNVGGSFYDFAALRFDGTQCISLVKPPDDWGGRAAIDWMQRMAVDRGYDDEAERLADVAHLIDRIYASGAKR
jgi:predicted dehydrogenase